MNSFGIDAGMHYLDDFARHRGELPGARSATLRALREEAIGRFMELGLPTLRDEDWKYTNVAAIGKGEFTLGTLGAAPTPADDDAVAAQLDALALAGSDRLVFIDGAWAPRWSRLSAGARVVPLSEMLEREPESISAHLRALPIAQRSAFDALNLACMRDGAYVELAENAELEAPLHLVFLTRGARLATHSRTLIVAGAGSRATIIEDHLGAADTACFSNCVTEIRLARGARVVHHKLQQEGGKAVHVARIAARLGAGAEFVSTSLSFGAALARVDIDVGLAGEHASCELNGLYLGDGRQHVDHHTRIAHAASHCTSREFYKGIVGGAARAVFNGKVIVEADAQHSDAAQENRNLLLSDQAEVDTKPQLEIWADDVKCSHAATVGQVDEEQVFYLRSRGIAEPEARALLIHGFAAEVVERIDFAPLRERADALLRARYGQASPAL